MNKEVLIQAGIDFDSGLERFSGRTEIYVKYLKKFPDDTCYPALLEALENKDVENAFINAHSIKGTAGNLSLNGFYEAVSNMVEALRANDLDKALELLPAVKKTHEDTIAVLTSGVLDE
ncbi:MAG: Hpt domain-containing protein [Treponema sp.]|nr:Hpt domain-containing protein [Candidatus Treponema caballi]